MCVCVCTTKPQSLHSLHIAQSYGGARNVAVDRKEAFPIPLKNEMKSHPVNVVVVLVVWLQDLDRHLWLFKGSVKDLPQVIHFLGLLVGFKALYNAP